MFQRCIRCHVTLERILMWPACSDWDSQNHKVQRWIIRERVNIPIQSMAFNQPCDGHGDPFINSPSQSITQLWPKCLDERHILPRLALLLDAHFQKRHWYSVFFIDAMYLPREQLSCKTSTFYMHQNITGRSRSTFGDLLNNHRSKPYSLINSQQKLTLLHLLNLISHYIQPTIYTLNFPLYNATCQNRTYAVLYATSRLSITSPRQSLRALSRHNLGFINWQICFKVCSFLTYMAIIYVLWGSLSLSLSKFSSQWFAL